MDEDIITGGRVQTISSAPTTASYIQLHQRVAGITLTILFLRHTGLWNEWIQKAKISVVILGLGNLELFALQLNQITYSLRVATVVSFQSIYTISNCGWSFIPF